MFRPKKIERIKKYAKNSTQMRILRTGGGAAASKHYREINRAIYK